MSEPSTTGPAERLEQAERRERALAEVLRAVTSGDDLETVLLDIATAAAGLFDAPTAAVFVVEGDEIGMYADGMYGDGATARGGLSRTRWGREMSDTSALAEVLRDRHVVRFDDQTTLGDRYAYSRDAAIAQGIRSAVYVPMPSGGLPLGVCVFKRIIDPFTDDDVAVLQAFAAQAANAVASARRADELAARNAELDEALQLQTATSEVLRLISDNPGDLAAVLRGIVIQAAALCDADSGSAQRIVGDEFEFVALSSELGQHFIGTRLPGRLATANGPTFVTDVHESVPGPVISPARSLLSVPLRSGGAPYGQLTVTRFTVNPFEERHGKILQAFAEQASIAISNARVFNDLDESLAQQVATSEVLALISAHPGDLRTVLDGIVERAAALCDATGAAIIQYADGTGTYLASLMDSGLVGRSFPAPTPYSDEPQRFVTDFREIRRPDQSMIPDIRSTLTVDLRAEDKLFGLLTLTRMELRPFVQREGDIAQTFAEQAALAIANAKLFNDLDESLELQTATSEILALISDNPGNLQAVFDGIVQRAARLCRADMTGIMRTDLDSFTYLSSDVPHVRMHEPIPITMPDFGSGPFYVEDFRTIRPPEMADLPDWRSAILVPLVTEQGRFGLLNLGRFTVDPFNQSDGRILQAFADQAAIAISNAHLFTQLEESNREVTAALEQQTAVGAVLQTISRSAFDLGTVLNELAEQANRLVGGSQATITIIDTGETFIDPPQFRTADGMADAQYIGTTDPEFMAFLLSRAEPFYRTVESLEVATAMLPASQRLFEANGPHSAAIHPLMHGGRMVGLSGVIRAGVERFTDAEKRLLRTFADQAVIAVENARLFRELEERNREVSEALELQTATSGVLRLISDNPGDLQAVFDGITAQALRMCDADGSSILRREGPDLVVVSAGNPRSSDLGRRFAVGPSSDARTRFIDDLRTVLGDDVSGRSMVGTVLMVDGESYGFLTLNRRDVRPFEPRHGEILETFADQAELAIQNARLFHELEQRNNEVKAALEQQTAVGAVLQTISRSAFDLGTVLNELAEQANRLVGGVTAAIVLVETGEMFVDPPEFRGQDGQANPLLNGFTDPEDIAFLVDRGRPNFVTIATAEVGAGISSAARYMLDVVGPYVNATYPLKSGSQTVGLLSLVRSGTGRFTEGQQRLLQTFADQAVIAIENARLFRELEERNREVSEALEQQTAIAEVLEIISSSPTDLEPVLGQVLGIAARLCEADSGVIWQARDERFRVAAHHGYTADELAFIDRVVYPVGADNRVGRTAAGEVNRSDFDISAIPDLDETRHPERAPDWEIGRGNGRQAYLMVPLTRPGTFSGAFALMRKERRPFTERDEVIVQTFADQALIAIENSRLFHELQDSNREVKAALEQQTAVAAVLQTISRSAFDLDAVLDELTQQAHRLVGGYGTILNVYQGGSLVPAATVGAADLSTANAGLELVSWVIESGRARYFTARTGELSEVFPVLAANLIRSGHQTFSGGVIPLVSGTECLGAVTVQRTGDVRFTDSEKQLLQTFADQAVIAIENARLFSALQAKTEELEIASRHKSEFLANMSHELRTPLNAIIGYAELIAEECEDIGAGALIPDLGKIQSAGKHLLTLISGILDLAKVEAGRMDLFIERIDIAAMVTEVDQIVRPQVEKNRNTFVFDCPADVGAFDTDLVKVKQVLFNLLSNSAKFTEGGTITLAITRGADAVDFAITDTGIGMTDEQMGRLFEAFSQADVSTTRKYGGTGLGLALSRSFCQMMGGDITVTSEIGVGSTFTVTLPSATSQSQL